MIPVNTHETKTRLSVLLVSVEERGKTVVIFHNINSVSELCSIYPTAADPLRTHPELAGRIIYDPVEVATADEWPEDDR